MRREGWGPAIRPDTPDALAAALHDDAADSDFSGVIRVDHDGLRVAERLLDWS